MGKVGWKNKIAVGEEFKERGGWGIKKNSFMWLIHKQSYSIHDINFIQPPTARPVLCLMWGLVQNQSNNKNKQMKKHLHFHETHISKLCLSNRKMQYICGIIYSTANWRIPGVLCPEQRTWVSEKWQVNGIISNVEESSVNKILPNHFIKWTSNL